MESRVHREYLLPSLNRGASNDSESRIERATISTDYPVEYHTDVYAELAEAGLTLYESLHDMREYELQSSGLSSLEDARSQHKRSRSKTRTAQSCRLPCERSLPASNSSGKKLIEYQSKHVTSGGYDPLQLIRKKR